MNAGSFEVSKLCLIVIKKNTTNKISLAAKKYSSLFSWAFQMQVKLAQHHQTAKHKLPFFRPNILDQIITNI